MTQTITQYANATNTPAPTVRAWLLQGMPHTTANLIGLDVDKVEAWKIEKGKSRGMPKGKAAA